MFDFNTRRICALWAATLLVSHAAVAQPLSLPYESVFKDYQTHKDVPLLDWKASNEAVRAAGGWKAYQREAQAPDAPDAPLSPAPSGAPVKPEPTMRDKAAASPDLGQSQ